MKTIAIFILMDLLTNRFYPFLVLSSYEAKTKINFLRS